MIQSVSILAPIVILPLLGAIFSFFLGRVRRDWAGWIATAAVFLAFFQTIQAVSALGPFQAIEQNLFSWFQIGQMNVDFILRFDRLSAVMCLVVTGIGGLIHLYSIQYMHEDEGRHRYFSYLNLFTFAMLLLVLGGNLLVMFVGWEGVGLCSYLLIGFWYKNLAYSAAGMKAFLVNRIGDVGFLLALFMLWSEYGSFDFVNLHGLISANPIDAKVLAAAALCLFIGATGKSAQIPLFVWLPDAMAGPTPVSALIHAATMVTAGIYMMARAHFIFMAAPEIMALVTLVALITAFVAATTALMQQDIKKVLAYSTVSQLGFMFLAASTGAYWVAIFHLVTHAFFKACLFLGAGSVIHGCHHEQDMREMGGLSKAMPITFWTYLISTFAIAGIFPFAGYYSKHAIMQVLAENPNQFLGALAPWVMPVVSVTAFLTAFYMTRSLCMVFLGEYRGKAHPHESPILMTLPLVVLAALAIGGGMVLNSFLPEYLSGTVPVNAMPGHDGGIIAGLSHSWVGLLGIALGYVIYGLNINIPQFALKLCSPFSKLFAGKWFFDEAYQFLVVSPLRGLSGALGSADQSVVNASVDGVGAVVQASGECARLTQSGQVKDYAALMFASLLFIIFFYLIG
jgi:NADH-quinone oxidoreductase subunit L